MAQEKMRCTVCVYIHSQAVESDRAPNFSAALAAGRPVPTPLHSTIADGIATSMVAANAFATASRLVDRVVTVDEATIALAILRLVELEKCVVEGAGAASLAAVLSGALDEMRGKRVALVVTGGNIDTGSLGRVLETGMAADGRLNTVLVTISDRPGGLAELTRRVANCGASVKDVFHERAFVKLDVFSVQVCSPQIESLFSNEQIYLSIFKNLKIVFLTFKIKIDFCK